MKSFAISFDVEISRVARMSAQMQDIFILPALFFYLSDKVSGLERFQRKMIQGLGRLP